ncbi:hypothetical protein ACWN8B_10135 [Vagococcus zengguangii]|uniref:hypothetical protein n=1 Tax=Vagococcus zengguangii TaxID=2571750 RepID=UPI00143DA51E|nr:hypothetical protein [Vagococcus zengguangii]
MTTTTRRKKRKGHKAKLIEHLPTKDIHIHIEDADETPYQILNRSDEKTSSRC